jgi:hypothetical protein
MESGELSKIVFKVSQRKTNRRPRGVAPICFRRSVQFWRDRWNKAVARDGIGVYVRPSSPNIVQIYIYLMCCTQPPVMPIHPRSRIDRHILSVVLYPPQLVRLPCHCYWPSSFGFTIPRASAVSRISDHSGRGISTPSAMRPYVIPPSLLTGLRICGSRER